MSSIYQMQRDLANIFFRNANQAAHPLYYAQSYRASPILIERLMISNKGTQDQQVEIRTQES